MVLLGDSILTLVPPDVRNFETQPGSIAPVHNRFRIAYKKKQKSQLTSSGLLRFYTSDNDRLLSNLNTIIFNYSRNHLQICRSSSSAWP